MEEGQQGEIIRKGQAARDLKEDPIFEEAVAQCLTQLWAQFLAEEEMTDQERLALQTMGLALKNVTDVLQKFINDATIEEANRKQDELANRRNY